MIGLELPSIKLTDGWGSVKIPSGEMAPQVPTLRGWNPAVFRTQMPFISPQIGEVLGAREGSIHHPSIVSRLSTLVSAHSAEIEVTIFW